MPVVDAAVVDAETEVPVDDDPVGLMLDSVPIVVEVTPELVDPPALAEELGRAVGDEVDREDGPPEEDDVVADEVTEEEEEDEEGPFSAKPISKLVVLQGTEIKVHLPTRFWSTSKTI